MLLQSASLAHNEQLIIIIRLERWAGRWAGWRQVKAGEAPLLAGRKGGREKVALRGGASANKRRMRLQGLLEPIRASRQ